MLKRSWPCVLRWDRQVVSRIPEKSCLVPSNGFGVILPHNSRNGLLPKDFNSNHERDQVSLVHIRNRCKDAPTALASRPTPNARVFGASFSLASSRLRLSTFPPDLPACSTETAAPYRIAGSLELSFHGKGTQME